jgi:putative endonuclease
LPRSSSKQPCEKSSHSNAAIVRTETTRPRRTGRSIRTGSKRRNFATRAGSTPRIKKLNEFVTGVTRLGVGAGIGQSWFCYMLECRDGSLYVGIATDVDERIKRHNWGVGPAFTAKRRPVELIWSERCGSAAIARPREKEIKGWSRERKLGLLRKPGRPSACPESAGGA